jgi:glycosyltransferase involved in cell wall biosynthesis
VRDLPTGPLVLQRPRAEWKGQRREISSSWDVPSLQEEPDRYDWTVSLVAQNNWPDVQRCYNSVREHTRGHRVQLVLVESGSTDETRSEVDRLAREDPDAVLWHADHPLGEGAARNVALRQALGSMVLILDVSVELAGDILVPLGRTLARQDIWATGPKGLITPDCKEFHDSDGPEVHAVALYCLALPRRVLREVGWMDERFRFYRHLDLDYSFRIRSLGGRILVTPGLSLRFHPHKVWEAMDEIERFRKSRANFYLFYRKWHEQRDLFSGAEGLMGNAKRGAASPRKKEKASSDERGTTH